MKQKMKVLIIEDEYLARQRLNKMLVPYADQIEISGEATNGEEGLKMIEEKKPDFIFLDIQMPIMNGFEMLMKVSNQPYIIFTTAHDEYAIKAFEENSVDYLLKPIEEERLKLTMDKIAMIEESRTNTFDYGKIKSMIDSYAKPPELRTITVHKGDKIIIVNVNKIVLFHAEDKMTALYTTDEKKYLVTMSLSQLEERLPPEFMRLNRSCIVNEHEINEIRKSFNGKLVFEMNTVDKMKITTGSSYTALVKDRLKF
jgi:two-component system LytT family response regulator